jgi:uncharacterized protein YecE (DUF72 family)
VAGRLYAGTAGFAYPGWAPAFYPTGARGGEHLLALYAGRLPAVELHNTFYRRPDPALVRRWVAAAPAGFRFCPKAQRGSALRISRAELAQGSVTWLAESLAGFDERLGCVLLAWPTPMRRDDDALRRLLDAWPASIRLALELGHPSWQDDAVHLAMRERGVVLVATDVDGATEPDLRLIGPFLYLRLRRSAYSDDHLARWVARLEPFLAAGVDAYCFLRHDADGRNALLAERLASLVGPTEG